MQPVLLLVQSFVGLTLGRNAADTTCVINKAFQVLTAGCLHSTAKFDNQESHGMHLLLA